MHLAYARLYFYKMLSSHEDCFRRMGSVLSASGLVKNFSIITTDGVAVDMARNRTIVKADAIDADAIVWMDTDMVFPNDAIVRLVKHFQNGYPVVAGIYRRGCTPYEILTTRELTPKDGEAKFASLDELMDNRNDDGLTPIATTAMGFSITATWIFRDIAKRGIPPFCNWDFVTGHGQIGEDHFFYRRLHDLGIQGYVDPTLRAVHWPPYERPIPVVEDQPELEYTLGYKPSMTIDTTNGHS